jgi:YD repeat-containing protein
MARLRRLSYIPVRGLRSFCSFVVLLFAASACADDASFDLAGRSFPATPDVQFKLPKVLREISGLTLDTEGHLYAHNDEDGIIYRIDYDAGRVIERFALEGFVEADFEGIAIAGDRLFLVTSTGEIHQSAIGGADEMVPFERHPQRLDCEVEGLTWDERRNGLLAACKTLSKADRGDGLRLHFWDLAAESYDPDRTLTVPYEDLEAGLRSTLPSLVDETTLNGKKGRRIQPTGVTFTPAGNLLIVAGRQHLLLELSDNGDFMGAARLDPAKHRQAEGIAMTADGRLILSDEGDGKGSNKSRGRLSVYEPRD